MPRDAAPRAACRKLKLGPSVFLHANEVKAIFEDLPPSCTPCVSHFHSLLPVELQTKTKALMTMSDGDAGISLLTSAILHFHFRSGHATLAGPHVKGQVGLRYH